ncbi:MAG: DUF3039 domain-containing protein, partial [Candidatus Nanopelagicaceae bacterium]
MGLFTRRSGTDGLSDTALDERIQEDLESGDHERFAHY